MTQPATAVAAVAAVAAGKPGRRTARTPFYLVMAVLAAMSVVAGFFPTYFRPLATGALEIPPLVHFHGMLFLAWTVLFVVQPVLVRTGHTPWHRRLGQAGGALAAAMLVTGVAVALAVAARSVAAGDADDGRAFLLITLTDMLLFGVLVGCAIGLRRRVQAHKRLMLLATAALLPAAFGRLFWFGLGIEHPAAMHIGADSFLLAGVLFDYRLGRRIHSAYLWGGGLLVGVHVLRLLVLESRAWFAVADWILRLAG
jgi:hypothetical protein